MFGMNKLRDEVDSDRRTWQKCFQEQSVLITLLCRRLDAAERGIALKASELSVDYAHKVIAGRLKSLEETRANFEAMSKWSSDAFSAACQAMAGEAEPFADLSEAAIDTLFKDAQTTAQAKKKKKPAPKKKPKSRK